MIIPLLALAAGCSAELELDPGPAESGEALSVEANEAPRADWWRVEAAQHPLVATQPTLIASNTPEKSFIFGGYAYVVQDDRIAVVEARDPSRFCGMIYTRGFIRFFDVKGDTLYIANDGYGVDVVDVTDPCDASRVGTVAPSADYDARSVEAVGNRLFVVESQPLEYATLWQLKVFDTTLPFSPRLLATVDLGGRNSVSGGVMAKVGRRHLLVSFPTEVLVVDLGAGTVASAIPVHGFGGMAVIGNLVYLHIGNDWSSCRFQVWDLSDRTRPRLRGDLVIEEATAYDHADNLTMIIRPDGVFAFTGVAPPFMAFGSDDFVSIDVTDPDNPRLLATVPLESSPDPWWVIPDDIDVVGNIAYVEGWRPPHFPPGYEYYIVRVDISRPDTPRLLDFTKIPSRIVISAD